MSSEPVQITPDTKVGEMLDSFPELEARLLDLSPAFSQLKNPVLRRTVAKVTTLRHAARVGGVDLGHLINELRLAAGLKADFYEEPPGGDTVQQQPAWFDPAKVTVQLDVRPLLAAGEKPVGRVLKGLQSLRTGQIYEVQSSFVPAPLIDMAKERGSEVWLVQERTDLYRVFFCSPAESEKITGESLVDLE